MSSMEYSTTIYHHEFEEAELRLDYSSCEEDVMVDIEIQNGDKGRPNSRLTLTASEIEDIHQVCQRYKEAKVIMGGVI